MQLVVTVKIRRAKFIANMKQKTAKTSSFSLSPWISSPPIMNYYISVLTKSKSASVPSSTMWRGTCANIYLSQSKYASMPRESIWCMIICANG